MTLNNCERKQVEGLGIIYAALKRKLGITEVNMTQTEKIPLKNGKFAQSLDSQTTSVVVEMKLCLESALFFILLVFRKD